jgi:branched-chain amino acid transport system permease protein
VQFLQLVISGIAQGCIYGLIALGFVLIYKATETVSFAQGELMMLGAFGGLVAMTMLGFPFWLACPAPLLAMALLGVLTRAGHHPPGARAAGVLHRDAHHRLGYVGAAGHDDPQHRHRNPHPAGALQGPGLEPRRALVLNVEQMVVIAYHRACCAEGLYALFRYSKLGIAMQASSQNQLAAYYMGIPVKTPERPGLGLAAAVAAIAGLLLAPITFVHMPTWASSASRPSRRPWSAVSAACRGPSSAA